MKIESTVKAHIEIQCDNCGKPIFKTDGTFFIDGSQAVANPFPLVFCSLKCLDHSLSPAKGDGQCETLFANGFRCVFPPGHLGPCTSPVIQERA